MRASDSAPTSPDTKLRYAGRSSRSMRRDRRSRPHVCRRARGGRGGLAGRDGRFRAINASGRQGLASVTARCHAFDACAAASASTTLRYCASLAMLVLSVDQLLCRCLFHRCGKRAAFCRCASKQVRVL